MEARPSAIVFFSFFWRVRERERKRKILLSRLLLHRLLLLLQDFVTRARKGRGREPKPNETKHGSLLFAPPLPTRSVIHAHAHTTYLYAAYTCVRIYTYATHPRAFSLTRTRAPSLRSVPPSRTPFFLPSRFILRQRLGEVCRRPLLILSRRSTASPAVSLALLPCRFCVSYPLHARRPSHSFALRALSLEQPINSVGRRRVRTTILSLSSHRPTVLTPI